MAQPTMPPPMITTSTFHSVMPMDLSKRWGSVANIAKTIADAMLEKRQSASVEVLTNSKEVVGRSAIHAVRVRAKHGSQGRAARLALN